MTTIILGSKSAVSKQRGGVESECGSRVCRACVCRWTVQFVCWLWVPCRGIDGECAVCTLGVCLVGGGHVLCTWGLYAFWVDAVWTPWMWGNPRVWLCVSRLKRGCVDC